MPQDENDVSATPARQWSQQAADPSKPTFPRPGDNQATVSTLLPHLKIQRLSNGVTRVTRIYKGKGKPTGLE